MERLTVRTGSRCEQSSEPLVKLPTAQPSRRRRATAGAMTQIAVAAAATLHASSSYADCSYTSGGAGTVSTTVASNSTVVCSGTIATRLGQGPGGGTVTNPTNPANNVTVTVNSPTSWSLGNNAAISLFNNANIQIGSGTTLSATPTVTLQNNATLGGGLFGTGFNTVEVNANSTIDIYGNAEVVAVGTNTSSETINVHGAGTRITNYGYIIGGPSSAIFFENVGATAASPRNVVDNFGVIELRPGGSANPVTGGQAVGSNGAVGIDFINEPGATVIGNVDLQAGNDNVTLNPTSKIIGNLDGGGGSNTLTLNASPSSSDTLDGQVKNFQVMNKTGDGTWAVTGSVGNNTAAGAAPLSVYVRQGTLFLEGDNTNFNGIVIVNPANVATPDPSVVGPDTSATLEARAQSLPPSVINHGQVLFNQIAAPGGGPLDGVYAGVIGGEGAVTKEGPGTTVLSADNTYTGATRVLAGTLAVGGASSTSARLSGGGDITVASGATLGGYGTVAGNVTNAGTIAVANALPAFQSEPNGTFTLLGNLNNTGNLNLAGAAPGNVLLVDGNYTAGAGASLTLNTLVNPGGPLSEQTTDRLLIKGDPPGTTLVHVQPTMDSPGGFTSEGFIRPSDGISLVQVAGASTHTAFELPDGYVVSPNSPHTYRLYAYGPGSIHGTADPSQSLVGNAGSHWDYRLQSAYVTPEGPVDPDEPDGPVPGPGPEPGEEPVPGPGGEEAFPIPPDARPEVAPQVAAWLSAAAAYLYAGQLDIDMLHRRLGEIRDGQEEGGNGGSAEMFFRTYGGDFHYSANQNFQNYGYDTTGSYAAIQFGANVFRFPNASGVWRFGLAGTVGWLTFEPEAVDGSSRSQSNIYRLSGYATYQSKQGWYVDNILSLGWFNGTVDTAARGQAMRLQGSDYAASVEAGYPFALPYRFNLEPQLQLIGQHIGFHNATDVDGLAVNIGSQNQLTGRIGARITRPFDTSSGRITPYAGIDYLHAFVEGANVQVGDVNFAAGKLGDALQYGLGINGTVNPKLSLYGRVSYQQKIGNGGFSGWLLNGGARYVF